MYQQTNLIAGQGGAALTLDRSLAPVLPGTSELSTAARRALAAIAELDPVVDLGARIGSRDWLRGLVTCAGLCAAAWSLAPALTPLPTGTSAPMTDAQWQEARASSFSALAYGADTGSRMAATDLVARLADTPERPRIEISATLGQGDGFVRALERAGVASADARKLGTLVAGAIALDSIAAGTRMDLVLGRRANKREARPVEALKFRARLDLALALERAEGGALRLRRIPIAIDNTPLRITGDAGSSLYRAARAAGAPAKAVETYLRALAGHVSVGSIGSGARFDLVIAQRRAETGEVELGELLYAGLNQGKRKVQLLKWTSAGRAQWFEASGVGQRRGMLQAPVSGRQTSGFGMRVHPLLGYNRFHKGLDFGAAHGAPIVAATDGVVSFAGWNGGYGNFVKLSHAGGLGTGYGHMSRIAVRPGARVSQGQVIGYVGSTGMSTGPHLHYEVYKNGVAINPRSISFTTTQQLAGAELARFRSTLSRLMAVKPGSRAAPAERSAERSADAEGAIPPLASTRKKG